MRMDHLHESRDEITVELTVRLRGRHISQARFNLSSLTARNSQAKFLSEQDDTIKWRVVLEETCVEVLRLHRMGGEMVSLNGQFLSDAGPPILPPLLSYKSPTILYGEGGCGKSTIAAAAALSLETGAEVIPGMKPTPMKVLILDWEDEPWVWSKRLHELATASEVGTGTIQYERMSRPLHHSIEQLAVKVAGKGIEVVVIDSVGLAMGAGNEHMNAEQGALQMFEALKMLDCTSLLIDHVAGESVGKDSTTKPYGSIYKLNMARQMFELRREREPAAGRSEIMLIHKKSNYGAKQSPIGLEMVYEPGAIQIQPTAITAEDMQSALPVADRVVELLKGGKTSNTAKIAEALGVTVAAVRKAVQRDKRLDRISDRVIGLAGQSGTKGDS